jgi:hypothetical protein
LASAGAAKRPAIAAFVTAGFPSLLAWPELLQAVSGFCDVVEIGIPFSDPMADGTTIQRASLDPRHPLPLGWHLSERRWGAGQCNYQNPISVLTNRGMTMRI